MAYLSNGCISFWSLFQRSTAEPFLFSESSDGPTLLKHSRQWVAVIALQSLRIILYQLKHYPKIGEIQVHFALLFERIETNTPQCPPQQVAHGPSTARQQLASELLLSSAEKNAQKNAQLAQCKRESKNSDNFVHRL